MTNEIIQLTKKNLEEILKVERKAFIPSIQTTEKVITDRLGKNHVYLGTYVYKKLIGTLALRYAHFKPDFKYFIKRNSTFDDYAEKDNEQSANAIFIYSIGIIPQHRNGVAAKRLLQGAFNIAKQRKMEFLVGDARVPSYNGSNQNLQYEQFDKDEKLQRAIDDYFKTGVLPPKELIEQDPVAGFYLKVFPEAEVLGITNKNFWEGDEPCGGHMIIEYLELRK